MREETSLAARAAGDNTRLKQFEQTCLNNDALTDWIRRRGWNRVQYRWAECSFPEEGDMVQLTVQGPKEFDAREGYGDTKRCDDR